MTAAPTPSPAEQAVIDRFEAAEEPEEIRVMRAVLEVTDELNGWRENALRYAEHSKRDSVTGAMARSRALAYRRAIDGLYDALDAVR